MNSGREGEERDDERNEGLVPLTSPHSTGDMGTPLQLYLIREPRTLILSSSDYALVFKNPPISPTSNTSTSPSTKDESAVVVELLPKGEVNWDNAVMVNGRVNGSLGLLNIQNGKSNSLSIPSYETHGRLSRSRLST